MTNFSIKKVIQKCLTTAVVFISTAAMAMADYDVIIRDAFVLDGMGNPWIKTDVAINGDRIAAVGDLSSDNGARIIDAKGLYLSPGFIDVHSHAGQGLASEELSAGIPLVAQGITTVFVNPDGGGPTDLAQQKKDFLKDGLGVNVALLIPQGSVRRNVMGMSTDTPTLSQMVAMKALVDEGMDEGAFGLSSGLFYNPGSFSTTEEVIELAKIASAKGGVYTSHIRDESSYTVGVVAAVDEVIRIADEADMPGVVTHIKALGPTVWGYSAAMVERINMARTRGIEVWADQYPYEASGTNIFSALVPRWAQAGGLDVFLKRLADAEVAPRVIEGMLENLARRGGASRLQIRHFAKDPAIEGRLVSDLALESNMDPIEYSIHLLQQGGAALVSYNMNHDDIEKLMKQPWTMTGSDGDLVPMGYGAPHPRGYGTYPHKLKHYVNEKKVISLSQAIRSMTGLPAQVFRIKGRGIIQVGAYADINIFDMDKVNDPSVYTDPHNIAEGVEYLFVNGTLAVDKSELTDARAGKVLQK